MANSPKVQIPIVARDDVRAYIYAQAERLGSIDAVADDLGISRRAMYRYMQFGIRAWMTPESVVVMRAVSARKPNPVEN